MINCFLYLFIYLFSLSLIAGRLESFESLLSETVQPFAQHAPFAMIVESVDHPTLRYAYNNQVAMTPASVQKIITACVALRYWGPDHTYETALYAKDDNLYLVFQGDPNFKYEDLERLFSDLPKDRDWKNLYLMDSWRITEAMAPSWMIEDVPSSYASLISGAIIDLNRIYYEITPEKDLNHSPYIQIKKPYHFDNQLNMVGKMDKKTIDLSFKGNQWIFTGSIPLESPKMMEEWSVPNIEQHAIACVKECLSQRYPQLKVHYQKMPFKENIPVIAKHVSLPFSDTLIEAMQFSDNTYFDAVFLKIAQSVSGDAFLTWEEAATCFKQLAKQVLPEVDLSFWRCADGSGLSVKNSLNAQLILDILKLEANHPVFLNTLAVPGGFGSLRNRFLSLKDHLKAKIGGLSHVSTIAGYLYRQERPEWRFVILMNGVGLSNYFMKENTRQFQERLLNAVLKFEE